MDENEGFLKFIVLVFMVYTLGLAVKGPLSEIHWILGGILFIIIVLIMLFLFDFIFK